MVSFDWGKFLIVGGSTMLRIPAKLLKDADFPFKVGDQVIIIIENGTLIVKKAQE